MRIGICEWTTFPASFSEELAAYAAAGAGAIGILEAKLEGVDDVRGRLRSAGLAASACLPAAGSILPSPWIPGPEEPEARVESICRSVARFAELEASCVFFLTGPGEDSPVVREGIARIGEAGERHGVRVALEPIHPSQAWALSPVSSVAEALELIGDAPVGILFDNWHLPEVSHVDRVYGVHLSERREPTRSDFDRLLPGTGARAAAAVLVDGGYGGWLDVEVMSDQELDDSLWALPVEEIARRAVESLS
jgi:sugar phosphate isomerase/epimerase